MKPHQSIGLRVQAIVGLLVIVLVAACAISASRAFERRQQADRVMAITKVSLDLFAAMQSIRIERGTMDADLATPRLPNTDELRYLAVVSAHATTDLDSALARLAALAPVGDQYGQSAIGPRRATLDALRRAAHVALKQPSDRRPPDLAARWVAAGGSLTDALSETSGRLAAEVDRNDPFVAPMMNIGQLAWSVRAAAGADMLLLGRAVAKGERLTAHQRDEFNTMIGYVDAPWAVLQRDARLEGAPASLQAAIAEANLNYFDRDRAMRQAIFDELSIGHPSPVTILDYRKLNDQGLASLMAVASTALHLAAARGAEQAAAADRQLYGAIAVMVVAIGFGLLMTAFIIANVLRPIERITATMRAVADGDLDRKVPDHDRPDEVGELARALGVFRDNALAKLRLDEELLRSRLAKEAAESAARVRAQFLANMSHEIRTPLTGVVGFAELLERMQGLPEKAHIYTKRITTCGQALLSLVNDILDLSRIEAGQVVLTPQPFDLMALLRDTVDLIRPQAEKKGLGLSIEPRRGLSWVVCADQARLRQVLLNLFDNAIKFSDRGSVTIQVSRPVANAEHLLIKVTDTGVGISAEHADRLFQRFSQVDESNTRRYGGAGLGLAISKGLTELMGGEIGVDSQEGRGSTFWFTICAPDVERARPLKVEADQDWNLGQLRILVVDDVSMNRELVTIMLTQSGLQPSEAANGAEAVEAAQLSAYDLILMDLQMPVMDGLAATRAIRASSALNAATPIVAVSANVLPGQIEACRAAGMNDHIAKPINPQELLSKIARWTASAGGVEA